jgi:preprotein translocase subunit SecD
LPNLYGDDPSVQISHVVNKLTQAQASDIESTIKSTNATLKSVEFKDGRVLARLSNTDDQMKVADLLRDKMGNDYTVALNLAPTTPSWLQSLGGQAMYLGLDLRGGVHFLLEVDMDSAVKQAEERYNDDLRLALRDAKFIISRLQKKRDL